MLFLKRVLVGVGVSFAVLLASGCMKKNDEVAYGPYRLDLTISDFKKDVKNLTCKERPEQCRYFAVLNLLAFSNACFKDAPNNTKRGVDKMNRNWFVFNDKDLEKAVFSPSNKLSSEINEIVSKRFSRIQIVVECQIANVIIEQGIPEVIFGILSKDVFKDVVYDESKLSEEDFYFNTPEALELKKINASILSDLRKEEKKANEEKRAKQKEVLKEEIKKRDLAREEINERKAKEMQ